MLCEKCHQREATCHVTIINGDALQKANFCEGCYTTVAVPYTEGALKSLKNTACVYCGDETFCGGTDLAALPLGIQRTKFMCLPCSTEYNRFIQQRLESLDAGGPVEQQLAALKNALEIAEAHMKQWVSGKD